MHIFVGGGKYSVHNIIFLNIYIVRDIIMAIIHYVKDEHGQEPVFELIRSIALKGMEDEGYANLEKYIVQALDYLEDVGVPDKKLLPFYTRRDDGRPLTFATILKELKHHPPLLEFQLERDRIF